LIESETIEAVKQEKNLDIDIATPRRNIVTSGFSVNHLVNRVFRIGEVTLRGIALREPCPHLMEMTSHRLGVALMHRGGLGAEILSDGVIRVGDRIRE
jgi:MOSC domain-containing protein YiiM